jgi:hypothetical protein
MALVLTRQPAGHSIAALRCAATADAETTLAQNSLEPLRLGNPAARALPLLQLLARGSAGRVVLPMNGDTRLAVEVHPQ